MNKLSYYSSVIEEIKEFTENPSDFLEFLDIIGYFTPQVMSQFPSVFDTIEDVTEYELALNEVIYLVSASAPFRKCCRMMSSTLRYRIMVAEGRYERTYLSKPRYYADCLKSYRDWVTKNEKMGRMPVLLSELWIAFAKLKQHAFQSELFNFFNAEEIS